MATNKIILLTDLDDQVRYFTEDNLLEQLAGADIPGTGPIKGAFRNLANRVAEMRKLQSQYFSAVYGATEKLRMLNQCKAAEKKVDDILKNFNQVLERL